MEDTQAVQQALDCNETLQEEIRRLRKTVTMLRNLNGALRTANESLRRQNELAIENDKLFQQICETGFGVPVTGVEGGLPEAPAVESVVANTEEAS